MKQGTMNILFFVLKTKLLKNGEAPVLMRITINGDYDDARIQRSVPLNLWNAAKGRSKGRDRASVALNTYIAELHARSLGHIGEIQGTPGLHKERMLPACLMQPENEQLPQGNRRFLRHKEKSDHACGPPYFRDHRHARQ